MIKIVKYEEKYKDDLVNICIATMGEDFKGMEEYVKLEYSLYYTECEPDNCFVALVDGKAVGYCIASISPRVYKKNYKKTIMPRLKEKRFIKEAKFTMLLNDIFGIKYPSHMHIDIIDGYTKMGIGKRLIESQLENLRNKGSKGVHLGCDKKNINAQGFYKHLGFKVTLDTKSGIIFSKRFK